MIPSRNQVPIEDQWDLKPFFATESDWNQALENLMEEQEPMKKWPKLLALQGRLHEGAKQVKETLETITSTRRTLEKLYVYAHLRRDENSADDVWMGHHKALSNLFQDFGVAVSWFDPELLTLPESTLDELVQDPGLAEYKVYLQKIIRMKPYTLSEDLESLLAQSDKALKTARRAFSAFNDSDLTFPAICDSHGKQHELTHGSYSLYMQHPDRVLRENAFKNYLSTYGRYAHTLCELLVGNAERNSYIARARGYANSLEAALYPHNIDVAVYHTLIETVRQHLGSLHAYMELRRVVLKLDTLHPYDFHVSLVKDIEKKIPYEKGRDLVVESVSRLGPDYQAILKEGLKQGRWVDRYENRYKRSGAYSSGCYDSAPYILMNYKQLARDVSTLAHEAGHSMHSYLSHHTQRYQDADYPIFVAEVASTFNEELLADLMMQRAENDAERIFFLHEQIEKVRGTLFRQTLFAEFELFIHTSVEQHQPLTPQRIQAYYLQLVREYYGPAVTWDEEIVHEWSRIPHFYHSFYVYQYATGISAAIALANAVRAEETKPQAQAQGQPQAQAQVQGQGARDRYLEFLKSGGSRYPLDLLERAGVNMRSPEPVKNALLQFDNLVQKLRVLLKVPG